MREGAWQSFRAQHLIAPVMRVYAHGASTASVDGSGSSRARASRSRTSSMATRSAAAMTRTPLTRRGDLERVRERLARGLEHVGGELLAAAGPPRWTAPPSVRSPSSSPRRELGRDRAPAATAVDGRRRRAEDREAERAAELRARLRDPGRRRPLAPAARSPTARSAASVNSGARPSDMTSTPPRRQRPGRGRADLGEQRRRRRARRAIPPSITAAGRTRDASGGVSCAPTTNAAAPGTLQSPASSGE